MELGKTPSGGKMGPNLIIKNIKLQSVGKNQELSGFCCSKKQIKEVQAVLLEGPSLFPMRALYFGLRLGARMKWYSLNQPMFLSLK